MIQNNIKEWEKLGKLLEQCEWQHASRLLRYDEEVWWPEPWIEAMKEDPQLRSLAEKFDPLDTKHLSPMTPQLKDAARAFGLPRYKGREAQC